MSSSASNLGLFQTWIVIPRDVNLTLLWNKVEIDNFALLMNEKFCEIVIKFGIIIFSSSPYKYIYSSDIHKHYYIFR